MKVDSLRVVQYAYVTDKGATSVLSITENTATGETIRQETRYAAYPLYDCAIEQWNAQKAKLIDWFNPRKIRLNSNILGVIDYMRGKKGQYVPEVLYHRLDSDNRLSAWVASMEARRSGGDEDEAGDEVEAAQAADETEPSDIGGWTSATKNTKGND